MNTCSKTLPKAGVKNPAKQVGRKDLGETVHAYKKATYQDVIDAPDHKVAEIIDGTLHTSPRPAPPHARAYAALGGKLFNPYDAGEGGPGGWWILDEPELHFGTSPDKDVLVPDLAGWRRERMPALSATAYFTLAPDWVCEILSPATRHLDTGRKRDIYAREGIPYLWLIDPLQRTLEAFQLQDDQWAAIATLRDDAPVSLPPFTEAAPFPLSALWA